MSHSAKHQVFGSPGLPPEPVKPIPRPQWEVLARLIPGSEVRRPHKLEGSHWAVAGKVEVGGRYQRLEDGSEFDAVLVVDERALRKADELRSAFLLAGGDPRAIEFGLQAIRMNAGTDPVAREFCNDVERTLKLLLGTGEEVRMECRGGSNG